MARLHTQPLAEVSGLTIRRGKQVILRSIDWRIEPGQHWALIGANGSGKTSLLSALCGYLTPSAGSIHLCGHAYGRSDWRELRKKIGLSSSSLRQNIQDGFTAVEIAASGKDASLNARFASSLLLRQARTALRRAHAGHLADRDWACLSQGERQRVLIARALLADLRILILDEPCAGLDPASREQFLRFLQHLGCSRQAPALVLVTHHIEEIPPCCSHALILKRGRILASGPKGQVLTAALLSRAFGASARVERKGFRYHLRLAPRPSGIF